MTITQKIADAFETIRELSSKKEEYPVILPISDEEGEIYLYSGNIELNHFRMESKKSFLFRIAWNKSSEIKSFSVWSIRK
jgi:hypothetical protein